MNEVSNYNPTTWPLPNPEHADERPAWNRYVQKQLLRHQPPYCECAFTAKRSLDYLPWLAGFSSHKNSFFNRNDIELSHEHLFFSQSGHNVGFASKGLFGEKIDNFNYRKSTTCYSGRVMRKAISQIKEIGNYNLFMNNCQDFISKVKNLYKKLNDE